MDAPTAHRQIGTHEDVLIFERDLVELAARLGRLRPEVQTYRLFEEGTRELAIQVVCQVRRKEVSPTSPEFTFDVIEHNWGDGLMRVLRHAISRLVHLHYDKLLGTRYEHYGRIDSDGLPYQAAAHTPFSRHFCHTEALLHHTQEHLDHVQMVADKRGLEVAIIREDLQESIFSRHHLLAAKRKIVKKNMTLRQRVRELEDHLASLESHVSELEEETAELRKENEAVLGRDDDHQEAFDEEPASNDNDDRGSKSGDDCNTILDFYAPETPSEEDPEEVVPHISGDE
jgi:regulator of replication initiation timing